MCTASTPDGTICNGPPGGPPVLASTMGNPIALANNNRHQTHSSAPDNPWSHSETEILGGHNLSPCHFTHNDPCPATPHSAKLPDSTLTDQGAFPLHPPARIRPTSNVTCLSSLSPPDRSNLGQWQFANSNSIKRHLRSITIPEYGVLQATQWVVEVTLRRNVSGAFLHHR
jgi:hypothetical protein